MPHPFCRLSRLLPSSSPLPQQAVIRRPSCIHKTLRQVAKMTTVYGESLAMPNGTNGASKINAWQQPGPSSLDFRSDTMTTPTASMLKAIENTTLMDDVFLEDPTTNDLEAHIARLTGHEAALLVMSGTMGNQVSIRTHLGAPPHSVLCDKRSHIYIHEAGGIASISGAQITPITPTNNHHLTLADIEANAIISTNIHDAPTTVISLENTLNGLLMPLPVIQSISTFARTNNIKLHLDGARIWEVAVSTQTPLSSYTSLFDSVSLCFSKGLGAPIGSIIVGSTPFIQHARRIRKMFGGGTRQAGIIAAPARCAVDETFGLKPDGRDGQLAASHERAKRVAEMWKRKGGQLAWPVETNMVWLDLKAIHVSEEQFVGVMKRHGLKAFGGRLVVHYQIGEEAVRRLEGAMAETLDSTIRNTK